MKKSRKYRLLACLMFSPIALAIVGLLIIACVLQPWAMLVAAGIFLMMCGLIKGGFALLDMADRVD